MLVLSLKSLCMYMTLTLVTFNSCKGSKLLYFLVDGFRWDYFSLPDIQLTGFPRLFREGTRTEWMIPDFPTNSIPNYKTLETGLHVENHGMTGNYMYDEEAERHFELGLESDSSYHPDWWSRTESFFTTAEKQNAQNNVDVIVLSDHGMASIDQLHVINITGVLDMKNVRVITEGGSQAYIWPKEGKEEQVYNSLKDFNKHLTVYYKKDIKNSWYFTHHKLIPPIFLTVDKGWILTHPKSSNIYFEPSQTVWQGNHGFDNEEEDMRSIFVAYGPDFKKNYVVKQFNNVNVYQIICHVTGIVPRPHNGTWSDVMDMFLQYTHEDL